jgi:hypothetical protein
VREPHIEYWESKDIARIPWKIAPFYDCLKKYRRKCITILISPHFGEQKKEKSSFSL